MAAPKKNGHDPWQFGLIGLDEVVKLPRNPKDHDLGLIHTSLTRWNFLVPLTINTRTGRLVAGHGRVDTLVQVRDEGRPRPKGVSGAGDSWQLPAWFVDVPEEEEEAVAVALNQSTIAGGWNEQRLVEVLSEIAERGDDALRGVGFDEEDLDALIQAGGGYGSGEDEDAEPSSGELLSLVNISIAEPVHRVERGEVWKVGDHWLVCASVLREWQVWTPYLKGEMIFAPFAGPFVPLTEAAVSQSFVMVQPDPYIAGHILDRYVDIYGENSIERTG